MYLLNASNEYKLNCLVFATLVTYDAVLCGKVVEMVLYLCYSDMQQCAAFRDHTTL